MTSSEIFVPPCPMDERIADYFAQIPLSDPCEFCDGEGVVPRNSRTDEVMACPVCKGKMLR
jgi:hypothetical protein